MDGDGRRESGEYILFGGWELGEPAVAATHIADALEIVGESGESAVSLRYDLGEALLAVGRRAEALEAFKKVAGRQPAFRDVADRIAELS